MPLVNSSNIGHFQAGRPPIAAEGWRHPMERTLTPGSVWIGSESPIVTHRGGEDLPRHLGVRTILPPTIA